MKSQNLTLPLILCAAIAVAIPARAGILESIAEKKKDSVKEFDLNGDPTAMAKTFVGSKKLSALKGIKRVVIPNFYVEFAVENHTSAFGGGSAGTASVKSSAVLLGPTEADFQKIANDLYDKLVTDLKAMGIEVIPYETLKENKNYQRIKSKFRESPHKMRSLDGSSVFCSAHGMPMYFFGKDGHVGGFSAIGEALTTTQPQNIEPSVAKDLDATLLSVSMMVDIAKQKSSGHHMMGGFASVKTEAELNIMADFTNYKLLTPHNGQAILSLSKNLNSSEQIFEMKKGKDMHLDSSPFGGGNSSQVGYWLSTTPETYSKAVTAHLNAAHGMFMAVLKQNL